MNKKIQKQLDKIYDLLVTLELQENESTEVENEINKVVKTDEVENEINKVVKTDEVENESTEVENEINKVVKTDEVEKLRIENEINKVVKTDEVEKLRIENEILKKQIKEYRLEAISTQPAPFPETVVVSARDMAKKWRNR